MHSVIRSHVKSEFGHKFRWLRLECGIKQSELADLLGIHQTRISRIEAGATEARFSEVVAVCEHFGVPLSHFSLYE